MAMKTCLLLAAVLAGCGEMVSEERAVQAVTDEGYTNVRVTGKHGIAPNLFGCSDSDAVAFEVTGTNSQNRRVNMTVCCGLVLKGCTIRH